MRDLERWKDRVELLLDGRQIFFLFFGSAVAACLIFVAGVLVGKRIEHRALAVVTSEDPLAALDQLGTPDEDEGLTFHQTLTSRAPHEGRGAPAKETEAEPIDDEATPLAKVAVKAASKPQAPVAAKAVAKHEPPRGGPLVVPSGKTTAGSDPRFTLQLSSFSERAEAEQFIQKMRAAGYRPFLVQSDVPGHGLMYRVRVGDFASRRAAGDAKLEFERKQHVIAYIAKL